MFFVISSTTIYLEDYNPGINLDSDSSTAIQNAITDAIRQQAILVFPAGGRKFRVDKQLVVQLDRDSPFFELEGNNAMLYPNFDGICLFIEPLCPFSEVGSGREVSHFKIQDLTFDAYFNENSRAIQIGKNGFALSDFKHSSIEHVLMLNFYKKHPLFLEGSLTRNVNFRSVVSRTNGFEIISNQVGGFVGDMTFDGCEATGGETKKGFVANGSGGMIRGIRVVNSIFYGGVELQSSIGGQVADFWFTNMAIDRPEIPAVVIKGLGGQFSQLFFENAYIVGSENPAVIVDWNAQTSKISRQVVFRGGNVSTIKSENVFSITGGVQVLIDGISFSDLEADAAIKLINTQKSTIINCNCVSVAGHIPNHLIVIDEDCKDLVVSSNQGETKMKLILNKSKKVILGSNSAATRLDYFVGFVLLPVIFF